MKDEDDDDDDDGDGDGDDVLGERIDDKDVINGDESV